jgi:diadenosine tetraphosphate (Ap4A) HIT family hydrolase
MLEAHVVDSIVFQSNCEFCDEFAGSLSNSFHARYQGSPGSRFVLSTDNFHVFPTIGQIVDGYLLAVPKRHYAALDEMPQVLWVEFERIYDRVRWTLSNLYGPCIAYEHGARRAGVGGCGIYHAHLHVVPLARASDPIELLKLKFPYEEFADLSEIGKQSAGLTSYLFYQDSDARLYVFDTGPLPSQYMRKVLANALGQQDWNWRDAGREERLLATIRRLSGRFDSAQDFAHIPTHDAL